MIKNNKVYTTGDKCPISGYWRLEVSSTEMIDFPLQKGDRFPDWGVKNARWVLKKQLDFKKIIESVY